MTAIIRTETTLTTAVALLFAAHPAAVTDVLRAAGANLPDNIDPASVTTEEATRRRDGGGRLDITAAAGEVAYSSKGNWAPTSTPPKSSNTRRPHNSALSSSMRCLQHSPSKRAHFSTLTASPLCSSSPGRSFWLLSTIRSPKSSLPNSRRSPPTPTPESPAAALNAAITVADLGAAQPTVTSAESEYPTIDLLNPSHDDAFGQVQRERSDQYVGTVGIRIVKDDLGSNVVCDQLRSALRAAGSKLDAAEIRYRTFRHTSTIHETLEMTDDPWLARGYSSGDGGWYLGVKVPGDALAETLTNSARALAVYSDLCHQTWLERATSTD